MVLSVNMGLMLMKILYVYGRYIPVDFIVMRHSIVRLMGTSDGNLNTVPHLVLTGSLLFCKFRVVVYNYIITCRLCNALFFINSFVLLLLNSNIYCIVCTTLVLCLRFSGLSLGDAFGLILDFTGGVAGSMTSYVMPAAIYLKLMPKTAEYYYPAVLMLIFGLFVMIMVPTVSILYF
jgi:hypothetical protein